MRENMGIYRGKRIDNGEWVEGNLLTSNNKRRFIVTFCDSSGCFKSCPEILYIEVDPSTVGEWTGLMDKNGKRIFEGDIVSGRFGAQKIIGNVVYGSDGIFFIDRKGLYGIGLNNTQDWLEVIGTIYDNPELVKE